MPVSDDFARAWYAWMHAPEPMSNFHLRNTGAPTYSIERDLYHLASYVYWLGGSAIKQESSDYARLASRGLAEIERIRSGLESCLISESEKEEFREYLFVTSVLLEELAKLPSGKG